LYLERVHPKTAVASLDSSQIAVLYRTGQSLLRSNLGPGWRNTRLEAAAAGPRAGNRDRLWVYGRRGQPCHRCGSAISYARLGRGNRSTYWCDACQIRAPFSE
jgi:endonuclease-8